MAAPLLDAAGVGAGSRVLDVACGPGEVASIAAARGAVVTGVDVAAAMVARASAAHPEITFREANAEALPFPDASFDAAVANFLILHLADPDRGASELARVLVAGGAVALTSWDHADRAEVFGLLDAAVERVGAPASGGVPEGPDPFRFADDAAVVVSGPLSVRIARDPFRLVFADARGDLLVDAPSNDPAVAGTIGFRDAAGWRPVVLRQLDQTRNERRTSRRPRCRRMDPGIRLRDGRRS